MLISDLAALLGDAARPPPTLLDVRTPAEFGGVHIAGSVNVPLGALPARLDDLTQDADAALVLICRTGQRAEQARRQLDAAGVTGAVVLEGGLEAWERAGQPVQRGEAGMSLERQVRIAAGSLVVLGVALGVFVHPGFLGLAGFVGAGLVFAGITDTCGMGLLLARMPWNRAS